MPQLDELHGPLDVAQAAAAQLQMRVPVRAARQPLRLHAGLEPAHLPDRGLGHLRGPPQRIDEGEEVLPQRGVARDGAGPQQRLRLPRLGPLRVVRAVGVEAAHQRSRAPLGPQIGVDDDAGVRTRLRGRLREGEGEPLHVLGQVGAGRRGRVLPRRGEGPVDEHDVGVRVVADLGSAQPSHRDDRELVRRDVGTVHLLAQRGEQPVEVDIRVPAQGSARLADVHSLEHVRQRGAQQLAPVEGPQRSLCLRTMAGHEGARLPLQCSAVPGLQRGGLIDPLDSRGSALQQSRREDGSGQDGRQGPDRRAGVPQEAQVPAGVAHALAQLPEGQQARIRVHTCGQPIEHRGQDLPVDDGGSAHSR